MGKKLTDAKRDAIARYDAAHTKQINLKLNTKTDSDILGLLDLKENVQGYIKELIRNDMKGESAMTYKIKPEYLDLWEGGDTPSNLDRIITEDELADLSREWDIPVEKLLEQLIPQE